MTRFPAFKKDILKDIKYRLGNFPNHLAKYEREAQTAHLEGIARCAEAAKSFSGFSESLGAIQAGTFIFAGGVFYLRESRYATLCTSPRCTTEGVSAGLPWPRQLPPCHPG